MPTIQGTAKLSVQSSALGAGGATVLNWGWIFAEDEALKLKLKGLLVSDANNASRQVPVRFRLPENEVANMTYPSIIIEHAGWNRDPEREHRGITQLQYAPTNYASWLDPTLIEQSPYETEFPIPYNLDYQVTIYARFYNHILDLTGQLAQWNLLPSRNGFLAIPQDGTVRRLDLLGGPEPDFERDNDGKRIFKSLYSVRVSSELLAADISTATEAMSVALSLSLLPSVYFN